MMDNIETLKSSYIAKYGNQFIDHLEQRGGDFDEVISDYIKRLANIPENMVRAFRVDTTPNIYGVHTHMARAIKKRYYSSTPREEAVAIVEELGKCYSGTICKEGFRVNYNGRDEVEFIYEFELTVRAEGYAHEWSVANLDQTPIIL